MNKSYCNGKCVHSLVVVSYSAITHNFYNLPISFFGHLWKRSIGGGWNERIWPIQATLPKAFIHPGCPACFFPSFSAKGIHGGVRGAWWGASLVVKVARDSHLENHLRMNHMNSIRVWLIYALAYESYESCVVWFILVYESYESCVVWFILVYESYESCIIWFILVYESYESCIVWFILVYESYESCVVWLILVYESYESCVVWFILVYESYESCVVWFILVYESYELCVVWFILVYESYTLWFMHTTIGYYKIIHEEISVCCSRDMLSSSTHPAQE
jgi:hypothetical protein